jgi:hypothetical protein
MDRNEAAREMGYQVYLFDAEECKGVTLTKSYLMKLLPLESSPKNDVLIGILDSNLQSHFEASITRATISHLELDSTSLITNISQVD